MKCLIINCWKTSGVRSERTVLESRVVSELCLLHLGGFRHVTSTRFLSINPTGESTHTPSVSSCSGFDARSFSSGPSSTGRILFKDFLSSNQSPIFSLISNSTHLIQLVDIFTREDFICGLQSVVVVNSPVLNMSCERNNNTTCVNVWSNSQNNVNY